jgi:hypothetical protein
MAWGQYDSCTIFPLLAFLQQYRMLWARCSRCFPLRGPRRQLRLSRCKVFPITKVCFFRHTRGVPSLLLLAWVQKSIPIEQESYVCTVRACWVVSMMGLGVLTSLRAPKLYVQIVHSYLHLQECLWCRNPSNCCI